MEPPQLLPHAAPAPLTCEGNTQAPVFALGAPPPAPTGLERLLAGLGSGLRAAGSRALALLGPAPLYAVDGGAGGRTRLASDFVAALPLAAASLDSVVVHDERDVPVTILQISSGFPATLTAVPLDRTSEPAPVPIPTDGIACTWTVDAPAVIRPSAATGISIGVERLAPGAARLDVACTDGVRTVTATIEVPDMSD
jgi:hypothetical protein